MKFQLNEIADEQLETIGLTKKDIEKLPEITRNTLLSGNRTSLIRLNNIKVEGFEKTLTLDAKLSLERMPDGSASLRLHPINHVAPNVFGLSDAEEKQLQKDKKGFIRKDVMFKNGIMQPVIIAFDKTTNEYIAIKEKEITLPEKINGQRLSDKQKKDFAEGKEVKMLDNVFRFRPTNERMIEPVRGKLDSIEFKHTKYNSSRLLIDLALISSGLGAIVLIEHLLDLAASSKFNYSLKENLQDKNVRDAVSTAISETVKDNKGKVTPDQLSEILSGKLKDNPALAQNNMEANQEYLKNIGTIISDTLSQAPKDGHSLIINPDELMEDTISTVEDKHLPEEKNDTALAEENTIAEDINAGNPVEKQEEKVSTGRSMKI